MPATNPVREALTSGRFSYMVELVAGAKTTEEQLVETAAAAGAGSRACSRQRDQLRGWFGRAEPDPHRHRRGDASARADPNIHLTCVGATG